MNGKWEQKLGSGKEIGREEGRKVELWLQENGF